MSVTFICESCGEPFTRKYARNPVQRFCSPTCGTKKLQKQIQRTCIVCGKEFQRQAAKISDYCSSECSHIGHRKDITEAFWSKVNKSNPNGCWIWTGGIAKFGHGLFTMGHKGRTTGAHRFAYEQTYGAIPDNLCVCHHCDNPSCVRPDHLFLGTRADNNQDCINKNRHSKGELTNMAKLTEDNIRAIRSAPGGWGKIKALADLYGVDPRTITMIRKHKAWKHVT